MHSDHGGYTLITAFGSLGGSQHTTHDELMDGRTPITSMALVASNNLREFLGLANVQIEEVGWIAMRYDDNIAMLAGIAAKQWTESAGRSSTAISPIAMSLEELRWVAPVPQMTGLTKTSAPIRSQAKSPLTTTPD